MTFEIKNISVATVEIENIVQVNTTTPDVDDGHILAGQVLDLLNSFCIEELAANIEITELITEDILVLVIDGVEYTKQQSLDYWHMGAFIWSIDHVPGAVTHLKNSVAFQSLIRDSLKNLVGVDRLSVNDLKDYTP